MISKENYNLAVLSKHNVIKIDEYVMRPLHVTDLLDYHEITSDEETLKFDYPAHTSLDESLEMLVKWNLSQPIGKYGIEDKTTKKIIGIISLRQLEDSNSYEIGYTINRNYWRKGIAYSCIMKISKFTFQNLKIDDIIANVHEYNTPSIKLLEKLGFIEISNKKTSSLRYKNFNELTFKLTKENFYKTII